MNEKFIKFTVSFYDLHPRDLGYTVSLMWHALLNW